MFIFCKDMNNYVRKRRK